MDLNDGRRTETDYDCKYKTLGRDEVDSVLIQLSPSPPTKKGSLTPRQNSFKFDLHTAAKLGQLDELQKILAGENGKSEIWKIDLKGRTPLHYAASFANHKCSLKCVNIIMKFAKECAKERCDEETYRGKLKDYIDIQDRKGESALHLAAINEHKKVVEILIFAGADVNLRAINKREPIQLIYSKVPEAMLSILDRAVRCGANGEPHDENLKLKIDFSSIIGYPLEEELEMVDGKKLYIKYPKETELLGYILRKNDSSSKNILLHPFIQLFLHLKWKKIQILFWISILFHIAWLIMYTKFTRDVYVDKCPYKPENATVLDEDHPYPSIRCDLSFLNMHAAYLLLAISVVVGIKEFFEMCSLPKLSMYFTQLENWGQWLLIFSVFTTTWPAFVRLPMIPSWQYQAASFGIFLAWALILSQIGKLPLLGIYVEILGKVLKSFAMFIITFMSLLIAFALSLSILMPEKQAFHSLPLAILKVLVMMTGELNYDDVFHGNDEIPPFPVSGHILYGVFTIIVTIILFNLLIGFTVSDIQALEHVAQASRLASQLEQIFLIESFILSDRVQNLLTCFKKQRLLNYFLVVTDDCCEEMEIEISIKKVPVDQQKDIRRLAALNVSYSDEEESELFRNSTDNVVLKKRLKTIMEEIHAQWDFL